MSNTPKTPDMANLTKAQRDVVDEHCANGVMSVTSCSVDKHSASVRLSGPHGSRLFLEIGPRGRIWVKKYS